MQKRITAEDVWKALRSILNKDLAYNPDWEASINFFLNRFKTKYFDPIEKLIDQNWLKGEGFTILTVYWRFPILYGKKQHILLPASS